MMATQKTAKWRLKQPKAVQLRSEAVLKDCSFSACYAMARLMKSTMGLALQSGLWSAPSPDPAMAIPDRHRATAASDAECFLRRKTAKKFDEILAGFRPHQLRDDRARIEELNLDYDTSSFRSDCERGERRNTHRTVLWACPGFGKGTYNAFLDKHSVGNPGDNSELFVRVSPEKFRCVRPFKYNW